MFLKRRNNAKIRRDDQRQAGAQLARPVECYLTGAEAIFSDHLLQLEFARK